MVVSLCGFASGPWTGRSWALGVQRTMTIPKQCVGSSLVAAGAIAGTLALHEGSRVPKTCILGSQVALATAATLAVHHVDITKVCP